MEKDVRWERLKCLVMEIIRLKLVWLAAFAINF